MEKMEKVGKKNSSKSKITTKEVYKNNEKSRFHIFPKGRKKIQKIQKKY